MSGGMPPPSLGGGVGLGFDGFGFDGLAVGAGAGSAGVGTGTGTTTTGNGTGLAPPFVGSGRVGNSSVMVVHATTKRPTAPSAAIRIPAMGPPSG